MSGIERAILEWLQRRCKHPGANVVADILQRDHLPTVVRWCRTCGAYATSNDDGTTVHGWIRTWPTFATSDSPEKTT